MRLGYEGICIRNAEEKDCQQLALWWNDGSIMAHAGFPDGLGTTPERIREKISDDSDEIKRRLIIEYKGLSIGEMNFMVQDEKTVEIGIKICDPEYQNRGIGRTVLHMLIQELFDRGFEKIVLDTDFENRRAQHVYELLGFIKTAVHQNAWINQKGEARTSVDYELVKENFKECVV